MIIKFAPNICHLLHRGTLDFIQIIWTTVTLTQQISLIYTYLLSLYIIITAFVIFCNLMKIKIGFLVRIVYMYFDV